MKNNENHGNDQKEMEKTLTNRKIGDLQTIHCNRRFYLATEGLHTFHFHCLIRPYRCSTLVVQHNEHGQLLRAHFSQSL